MAKWILTDNEELVNLDSFVNIYPDKENPKTHIIGWMQPAWESMWSGETRFECSFDRAQAFLMDNDFACSKMGYVWHVGKCVHCANRNECTFGNRNAVGEYDFVPKYSDEQNPNRPMGCENFVDAY